MTILVAKRRGYNRSYQRRRMQMRLKSKSTPVVARRALRLVKQIKSNVERKHYQFQYTTQLATTSAIFPLTNIAQGDTVSTRTGNKITLRSIKVNGQFSQSSGVGADNSFRVILFTDRQQIADTDPGATDLLRTDSIVSSYANTTTFQKRFKIYYDRVFVLRPRISYNGTTVVSTSPVMPFVKWFFPTIKDIRYNADQNTDIQRNGLYMLLIGQSADVTPNLEFDVCYSDY